MLPVFFLFLSGLFEVGHIIMVRSMVRGACRSAARFDATEDVTTAEVASHIRNYLGSAVNSDAVTISIKDASVYDGDGEIPNDAADFEQLPDLELINAESRQLFLVRATIDFDDVSYLDLPFFKDVQLSGVAFTRHE